MSISRKELKDIVKETLNENYGLGLASAASDGYTQGGGRGYQHPNEEAEMDDMQADYDDILKNLDGDPGYDQAIMICKCLIRNKPILREILELIKAMPELQEEFLKHFKESHNNT